MDTYLRTFKTDKSKNDKNSNQNSKTVSSIKVQTIVQGQGRIQYWKGCK